MAIFPHLGSHDQEFCVSLLSSPVSPPLCPFFGCRYHKSDALMNRDNSHPEADENIIVSGEYTLPLSRQVVWEKLNQPIILQHCIKGCDEVAVDNDGHFHAHFSFRIGPFRKHLEARLQVERIQPPEHFRLSSRISARALGEASGSATVLLNQSGSDTVLSYRAEIKVNGWFARMGRAMIEAAATRYMTIFFSRFVEVAVVEAAN